MRKAIILLTFFLITIVAFAQIEGSDFGQKDQTETLETRKMFDFGLGLGLDYGGIIGVQFTFVPIKHLGIFFSGGYHMVAFGWQVGATGYIVPKIPEKKIRPYLKVMYGSNRVIVVDGASQHDKNYIGFTPGFGVEFRFGSARKSGLNIDLNVPIESTEFKDDYDALDKNPGIEMTAPLPIAFSIGYHFEF